VKNIPEITVLDIQQFLKTVKHDKDAEKVIIKVTRQNLIKLFPEEDFTKERLNKMSYHRTTIENLTFEFVLSGSKL